MSKVKRQANWPAQTVRALEVTIAKLCAEVDERHAIEIDDIQVSRSAKGGYVVKVSYFYDLDREPHPAAKGPSLRKRINRKSGSKGTE